MNTTRLNSLQRAVPVILFGFLLAATRPVVADDDPVADRRLARQINLTAASAQPLTITRSSSLYDPASRGLLEFVMVCSQPIPEPEPQGGSILSGVSRPDSDANELSQWFNAQRLQFESMARDKMASPKARAGVTDITILENRPVNAVDHRPALRAQGYTGMARRRTVVADQRVWAALYSRNVQPEEARLGDVNEIIVVNFDPSILKDGSVALNPSAEIRITPEEPPSSAVSVATWSGARSTRIETIRKSLEDQWLPELSRIRVTAPPDAEGDFEKGQAHTVSRPFSFAGEQHSITLSLTGHVLAQVAGRLGENEPLKAEEQPLTDLDIQKAISGAWKVWLNHPVAGKVTGYARVTESRRLYMAIDYPTGVKTEGFTTFLGVRDGKAYGSTRHVLKPREHFVLEISPNHDVMRGYLAVWDLKLEERRRPLPGETIAFRRLKPKINSVQVRVLGGRDFIDYPAIVEQWQDRIGRGDPLWNGEKPGIELTIEGRDLLRYGGGLGVNSLTTRSLIDLSDPSMILMTCEGNTEGTRIVCPIRLGTKAALPKPGTKFLILNGSTRVPFNLPYKGFPEHRQPRLEVLHFIPATGVNREDPASLDPNVPVVLSAKYDQEASDDLKQATISVEREGRTVLTLPNETGHLIRSADSGSTFSTTPFRITPAVASSERPTDALGTLSTPAAPYEFKVGDVIVGELDGVTTRLLLLTQERAVSNEATSIHFYSNPDGEGWYGGTYAGETRIDFLPVGQKFWIEVNYPYKSQTEKIKSLDLSWDEENVGVEVEAVQRGAHYDRDERKLYYHKYRGGPFIIDPSDRDAGGTRTPAPVDESRPESPSRR